MKKLWLIFLFAVIVSAQTVTVTETKAVTTSDQGAFGHPFCSPDGKLFFTSPNFVGLYYLDGTNNIITVSDKPGAGYMPAFSKDGAFVYYKPYIYKNARKFSSLVKQSLTTGQQEILISEQRNFSNPQVLSTGQVSVKTETGLNTFEPSQKTVSVNYTPVAFVENSKIALFSNGQKKLLEPLGEGHYIWPSVSPDGTKLLFVKAGNGTYISDLQGNILADLGYANAPHWSPDGKWIVFMDDKDDGHRLLSSDIYVISADGKIKFPITASSDRIEIYPDWGKDGQTIYYSSTEDIIYKSKIEIK